MNADVDDTVSENELDHAWQKRESAVYRAELSALYHQKRERFFELADKLSKAAAVFGGSAALWKIGAPNDVAKIAVFITMSSALSLVFSFSERSKRHAELARSYREILATIASAGDFLIRDSQASEWMGKICALDAKEPPALSALVVMCQNEIAMSRQAPIYPQSFFVRCIAHFVDWPHTA